MTIQPNDFVVYPSRKRLFGFIFLCCIFVFIGLLMIGATSDDEVHWGITIVGVLSTLFFGICLLFYMFRMIWRKPALIIGDKGLYDNSTYPRVGEVKWEEIEELELLVYMGQPMLGIRTKDPNLLYNRATGFKRWLIGVNKRLISTQINIPRNLLSVPLEVVFEEMHRRRSTAAAKEGENHEID
ncbi:RTA1 domain-containing protein [Paenibacillus turpanensis]|uniref:RTA1 domain-containing protein n=1 Tax=Paenibacillus turpanensis TaxID=2689078 RepID=UPI00140783EF|nr:RTA1 domain-containing protein [Paenibacillus turpanensis]